MRREATGHLVTSIEPGVSEELAFFFPFLLVLSARPMVCRDKCVGRAYGRRCCAAAPVFSASIPPREYAHDWRWGDGRVLPRTIAKTYTQLSWVVPVGIR